MVWRSLMLRNVSRLNQSAELIILYISPCRSDSQKLQFMNVAHTPKKCWLFKNSVLFTESPDFWKKSQGFFSKVTTFEKVFIYLQPVKCWLLKSLYILQKVQTFWEKSRLSLKVTTYVKVCSFLSVKRTDFEKVCTFYRKSRLLEKSQDFFFKSHYLWKKVF